MNDLQKLRCDYQEKTRRESFRSQLTEPVDSIFLVQTQQEK